MFLILRFYASIFRIIFWTFVSVVFRTGLVLFCLASFVLVCFPGGTRLTVLGLDFFNNKLDQLG